MHDDDSAGRTVRVDRVRKPTRPPRPAGLLRFYPIGAPPAMGFFALARSGPTRIGRARESEVFVDDEQASRTHAVVERSGDGWRVRDRESANGLYVNGRRVEAQDLVGGEVIRVGATLLRFLSEGMEPAVRSTGLVGGPALEPVRELLARSADSDLPVLITGETGTGKELAARSLHEEGRRAGKPFVAVNCSAIPREILESELFGHVKGAFTGATTDRPGLIRQASGGTLFLDEIGELPAESQAKLLRVLQEREVRPVGGAQPVPVDIRVVSATNRPLGELVKGGAFRPDLYARIAVIVVELPPLRERVEDIPLLVEHFIAKHASAPREIDVAALEQLCTRPWPFNVRELEGAVRRALLLAGEGRELDETHFAGAGAPPAESAARPEGPAATPVGAPPPAVPAHPMADRLREVLGRHRGDADAAARELGISRSQLYRRAKKLGITVSHFKV